MVLLRLYVDITYLKINSNKWNPYTISYVVEVGYNACNNLISHFHYIVIQQKHFMNESWCMNVCQVVLFGSP